MNGCDDTYVANSPIVVLGRLLCHRIIIEVSDIGPDVLCYLSIEENSEFKHFKKLWDITL